jgi:hypothetical protein
LMASSYHRFLQTKWSNLLPRSFLELNSLVDSATEEVLLILP